MKQQQLLDAKNYKKSYGGELMKTRAGRRGARPLATKQSMHLVLRSSKANGDWSFKTKKNERKIKNILILFAKKYGVRIYSSANVGNHLHIHLKLTNLHTYKPFIRATTSAIAMAVTGTSRWKPLKQQPKDKFWDYRPFTRIVQAYRDFLNLRDYIQLNVMEGFGYRRKQARYFIDIGELDLNTA